MGKLESMSRAGAIGRAHAYFDNGGFLADLTRRVAIPSSSQEPERAVALRRYLTDEIVPTLTRLKFACRVLDNPLGPPVLAAERIENAAFVTVLAYGHGDTVRGLDDLWRSGLSPWRVVVEGDRIYGRGTADNKGQHTINIAGLEAVLAERGSLGFNCKVLIEMGEEVGSAGLRELCERYRGDLFKADIMIGSDGPRNAPSEPTIFLGARGTIRVPEWRPPLPASVRQTLASVEVDSGPEGPRIDRDWGEPDLTPAERVFGWNSFEILAFHTGTPERPVNAIPGVARAYCQLRYVVGTKVNEIIPALERHLARQGFTQVEVKPGEGGHFYASRLDPADPWVTWAKCSMERTTGRAPTILPNLGGSLPNDIFADVLRLKTIWVPHSYAGCSQHAPNEHLLAPIAREGLGLMAGLFWDLGDSSTLPIS